MDTSKAVSHIDIRSAFVDLICLWDRPASSEEYEDMKYTNKDEFDGEPCSIRLQAEIKVQVNDFDGIP